MAFHNPDPKLRAIELENARLRAQAFAWLFRQLRRGFAAALRALARGGLRRRGADRGVAVPGAQVRRRPRRCKAGSG
jgi:hypothetical protein